MPQQARVQAQLIGSTTDGRSLVRVSCESEPVALEDGTQWIHICPGGPFVEARDGRTFQLTDALGVATRCELPLLVDWEHQSESFFGSTKAAGWVEEIYVQDEGASLARFPRAGIWGKAAWTPQGHDDVKTKTYRFLSPVLVLDAETRDVQELVSVALTNRPALHMQGLDSYREQLSQRFGQLKGEHSMKPETLKLLLAALSLADGATDEQIKSAFASLQTDASTAKELCGKLTKQLAEKDAALADATAKLADASKASFANEVKATLDELVKSGKATPATRAGYESMCSTPELFASFKANVVPHLPVIGAPAPESRPGKRGEFKADADVRERLRKSGMDDKQIDAAIAYQATAHERAERLRAGKEG
jgi:phage I-like protein